MSEKREVGLKQRQVGTRKLGSVEVFDVDKIEEHFKQSIDLISEQIKALEHGSIIDTVVDEMMRSQVVFIDSAFDYFIHEVIKLGIINMYNNEWSASNKYYKLQFTMKEIERVRDDANDDWLKEWIDEKYATETFMSSKAYSAACNLLDIKISNIEGHNIKDEIDELFSRRNLIAHQADRISATAERNKISIEEVKEYLGNICFITDEFIKKIKNKKIKNKNKR